MKKIAIVAVSALVLATAFAYAQMQHPRSGDMQQPAHSMPHGMMGPGHMMAQHHMGLGHRMGPGMRHDENPSTHSTHADRPKGDNGPSSLAFRGINKKMHEAMNIAFTGAADVDFVTGMIPHHQGAVDMAKTVLAFGKDAQVRKLAEEIIKAQESEIALMQAWLKNRGQ